MYIYFIRHPETIYLKDKSFSDKNVLSERGRKQAELTTLYVNKNILVPEVYSSESLRCINLAKTFNSKQPLMLNMHLNEGTISQDFDIDSFIRNFNLKKEKNNVVCVSHHHKIKNLVALLLDNPFILEEKVKLHPCSLTILRFSIAANSWELISLNEIEHLGVFTRYH